MVRHVAICGAGTMGGGIAINCLGAGLDVTVIDTSAGALSRMQDRVAAHLARQVEKGRLTEARAADQRQRLALTGDLAAIAGADLLIEAVFEDQAVKDSLFRAVAPHLAPSTLVATNTSALRVTDLARALPDPGRFLGLHYFSPAEINPVVEVVAGAQTADAAVAQALAFVETCGKTALRCKDAPGFAVNRFFCPYSNEAVRLLEEGVASAAQIDAAAVATLGMSLGPFAVMNIVKPRINMNAVSNLARLGPFYAPARLLVETGTADASWEIIAAPALPGDRHQQVVDRLRAGLFLPVLEALGEGVAAAGDFDLGARLALRFEQGPVAQIRALGPVEVRRLVQALCDRHDTPFPEAGFAEVFGNGGG